jgi:hypothetical protein
MNLTPRELFLVTAIESGRTGITYTQRHGAVCPWCKTRARVEHTGPIEGRTRIRYHRCSNPACPLHVFDHTIKSIEEVP